MHRAHLAQSATLLSLFAFTVSRVVLDAALEGIRHLREEPIRLAAGAVPVAILTCIRAQLIDRFVSKHVNEDVFSDDRIEWRA